MGCDIHSAIQIQTYAPYWDTVMVPTHTRSYLFFGTLAGVRDDRLPAIVPPRGYPPNSGPQRSGWDAPDKLSAWVSGDHSTSWFTLAEAKAYKTKVLDALTPAELRTEGVDEADFSHVCQHWDSLIEDMEYCKKMFWHDEARTDDNIRVVFNFDS
jgi:hypothetical protein